jgi:alkylation response protein AidB-like acyl-CoA dehydrogenase
MLNRVNSDRSAAELQARGAELINRARHLLPLIEGAADRIEKEREIPAEVLAALHDARLFRMLIPRSCGGEEFDPATYFQVIEQLAQADASVAWCVGQCSGVSMAAAYLKPEIAREIFGPPHAAVASGPQDRTSKAVVVEGGYRVSGNWTFASGSRHAQWLGGHCNVVEPDGSPRLGPDGKPLEHRTMLFPKSSATITDVWQVMGLKGTGSDNYSVTDLFVPADYSFTRESDGDRRESGPLYRFSIFNMFGVAFSAVALGIVRKALDDFIVLAKTKMPFSGTTLLRDNGVIQSQVGLSEARLQSARIYVLDTYRRLYDHVSSGGKLTHEQRINNRIVTTYAIQQAREVMNFVYHAAGATAIFESNPFERRFRDLHTATQQGQGHYSNFEALGQTLMGTPPSRRT